MLADLPGLRALVSDHVLPPTGDPETRAAVVTRRAARHALIVHVSALARADDWPETIRAALESARGHQARHALRLAAALGRVQQACDAEGCRLLALKGVALAAALHGDLAARQSQDLDVLVEPGGLGRVAALLQALGFSPEGPWREVPADRYRTLEGTHHEFVFTHPDRVTVEVHTRLTPAFIPYVPGFEALWDRRQVVRVAGCEVATPGWTDAVVHLSTHGYRHAWARLGWLCDIGHLMARADIRWDEVQQRARRQREWAATSGALLLAHELLGTALPSGLQPSARGRHAARAVRTRISEGRINPSGRDMLGDHWRSRDSVAAGAGYLWRVATTMTPADCGPGDSWPPSTFTRLVRRPLRLLRRYATGRDADVVPSPGR